MKPGGPPAGLFLCVPTRPRPVHDLARRAIGRHHYFFATPAYPPSPKRSSGFAQAGAGVPGE